MRAVDIPHSIGSQYNIEINDNAGNMQTQHMIGQHLCNFKHYCVQSLHIKFLLETTSADGDLLFVNASGSDTKVDLRISSVQSDYTERFIS